MKKTVHGKSPVIRRQLEQEIHEGKFSCFALMHMAHYDSAANHILKESKRLARPVTVCSVGCGDMWELRVLIGMQVTKADVLDTYVGIDYIDRPSMFGNKLSQQIEFHSLARDLDKDPVLPVSSECIDVVICTEFIEHISEESGMEILKEISRILTPGGCFYITTPNADNSSRSDKYHLHEYTLQELIDKLEMCDLHYHELYGTFIDQRTFLKINAEEKRIPQDVVDDIYGRFTPAFRRLILATSYPEYATGIAMFGRKGNGS